MNNAAWKWPPYPFVYEINTWPWLHELTAEEGRPVDLASVPDHQWDAIAEAGFDAVWLMGVWQRSPVGIALARDNPDLLASFAFALPGFAPGDIVGSPYCVRDYVVDEHLGGPAGLHEARDQLARRGVGLILDFVPNHVAPDHPWAREHPERFVQGTSDDLGDDPASFIEVSGHILARGRDPYFPAWPDVVQLNAFSDELRAAAIDTLRAIGDHCDGVRCDMAMLMMNDTFQRTWGERAGAPPARDYWPAVISGVRDVHPDMRFIAEAYWDLEWALQQQGFDYCYDKRLYDRLLDEDAEAVRVHLLAEDAYQARLLRFLENHDEPRAASVLDPARQRALAVATLTQTGARLVHHGQEDGRTVRLPVFLGRFPVEAGDPELAAFYRSLQQALTDPTFRHGRWRLCELSGWQGDDRFRHLVAWSWEGESRWLIVVNLSDTTAAGHLRAPWDDCRGRAWRLIDPLNNVTYDRSGDDLVEGMYVELEPWGYHLFHLDQRELR